MSWYRQQRRDEQVKDYRAKRKQKNLLTAAGVLGVAGGAARAPWAAKHAVRAAGKVSPGVGARLARVPGRARVAGVERRATAASTPLAIASGATGSLSSLTYAGRLRRETNKEGKKLGIEKGLFNQKKAGQFAGGFAAGGVPGLMEAAGRVTRTPRWREMPRSVRLGFLAGQAATPAAVGVGAYTVGRAHGRRKKAGKDGVEKSVGTLKLIGAAGRQGKKLNASQMVPRARANARIAGRQSAKARARGDVGRAETLSMVGRRYAGERKMLERTLPVRKAREQPALSDLARRRARDAGDDTWRGNVSAGAQAAHDKALPPYKERYQRRAAVGAGTAALGAGAAGLGGRMAVRNLVRANRAKGRLAPIAAGTALATGGLGAVGVGSVGAVRGVQGARGISDKQRAIRARGHQRGLDAVR